MCAQAVMQHSVPSDTLADVLERVLDKGLVIAGDIKIKLVDIELLTIQLRLVICSVEKAREIGLDWWARALPEALPQSYQAGTTGAASPSRAIADGSVASRSPAVPVGGIFTEAMRRAGMALSPRGGRGEVAAKSAPRVRG